MPQLATANTFSGDQTIAGTVKISGSGNGLAFPDGTTQATAAPGLSGVREFLASGSFTDRDAIIIAAVFAKKTQATPGEVIASCRRRLKAYDDLGER